MERSSMLAKILIAIGEATDAQTVLESGLSLAHKLGSQIVLLHVINPSNLNGFSPLVGGLFPVVNERAIEQYQQELQERERQATERLHTYLKQATELNVTAEISQNFGDPGQTICEVAKNWGADGILMGRNQKSVLDEIFVGSTSNYVLHHAHCSVIVIQLPGKAR
jgi:nucleotide-binding universal stress UspA family protein